ncbi:MAG: hypothetical protein ABIP95_09560 [Pelobium sp.]
MANLRNIHRLTALWALSEAGIGGILHSLQIPFSGFFLAAFAIIMIRLIAFFSENIFRSVIKATILVLMIKAAASPQSPVTAYLAVAFQGVVGAVVFGAIKNQNISSYITSILCLLQTALQKLIVLLVIFGASFFKSLDVFISDVFSNLGFERQSFGFWIVGSYLMIYLLWAIYIGYICAILPAQILSRQEKFGNLNFDNQTEPNINQHKIKPFFRNIIFLVFVLAGMYILALTFDSKTMMNSFYRALIVILLWSILSPLIKKGVLWVLNKNKGVYSRDFSSIFLMLPKLKSKIKPAYVMAKSESKGIFVYKYFVFNIIALSLYHE